MTSPQEDPREDAPWDGPYDWDPQQEAWVCQAHGMADCRQSAACVYYGNQAKRADPDGIGPRLPDGWLREQLQRVLPEATDEQVDALVALADDYGRQLREARDATR